MIKYVVAILVILSGMESAHGCERINVKRLDEIKSYLNTKDIGEVRIFSRPYTVETPIPMSSKVLEKNWEIRVNANNSDRKSVV